MKKSLINILIVVISLLFALNGCLMLNKIYTDGVDAVIQERDEQIFNLAYSIDNNLTHELFEVRTIIHDVISYKDVEEIEQEFLDSGDSNEMSELITLPSLQVMNNVYGILVLNQDDFVLISGKCKEIGYEIIQDKLPYGIYIIRDENDSYYISIKINSVYTDLEYYVLLDSDNFYAHIVPEIIRTMNWVVFYEEKSGLLLQNHDNQPAYMRLTEEEILERNDGYTIIMNNQKNRQRGAATYKYKNYNNKEVDERIITLPSTETLNGIFAIGVARDSERLYNDLKQENDMMIMAMCMILFFVILAFVSIVFNINRVKRAETQKRYLEKEKQLVQELTEAQLQNSLKQMQPHFMYNALSSIRELILENPIYAADRLYDFTTYLRACIRSLKSETGTITMIPFTEEIRNIEAYFNIEKMRLGDKLQIVYNFEDTDFNIVPLVIQPLVENAIRHGISKKRGKSGTVWISSRYAEDKHIIVVKDDGTGFVYELIQEEISNGTRDSSGLNNVILRLDKLMNASVTIDSNIGQGTEITVVIPVSGAK